MLHKIGTLKELDATKLTLPECVMTELTRDIAILDCEYGENRNPALEGGYSVVVETADDLPELAKIVDYNHHPCEWVTRLGKDSGWVSILFIISDDYTFMVFMPVSILPETLRPDLED